MSKKFSEMTTAEQNAALAETFDAMLGGDECEIHNVPTVANSNGDIGKHCPLCVAEAEKENAERVTKMNASIAFADWHAKTDN